MKLPFIQSKNQTDAQGPGPDIRPYVAAIFRGNRLKFAMLLGLYFVIILILLAQSWLLGELIEVITAPSRQRILRDVVIAAVLIVGLGLVQLAQAPLQSRFVHKGLAQYKETLFAALTRKNISAFTKENTARYLSGLTNDVNSIEENYIFGSIYIVFYLLLSAGALSVMLALCWQLALVGILLMGAFRDYEGSVQIDGRELRDADPDSLYDLFSLIGQNVFLFDDTLRSNVTMFAPCAEADLLRAVERSGLGELVQERGLDMPCGENGSNLSGGEKQRVSIARSLLRGTPVLLLDEATAALDNRTAFAVTKEILDLEGLTRVVVTHRLEKSLLTRYDEIIAMRDGKICERGTFEELMSRPGYFYSLYTVSGGA